MRKQKIPEGWVKVIFGDDCIYDVSDTDHEFATCPDCLTDYADCECPGPHQEDLYEYQEFNGVLYAKLRGVES